MQILLGHQGGWDEAAMVLVPLIFMAGLLRLAHVRAGRLDDVDVEADADHTTAPDRAGEP